MQPEQMDAFLEKSLADTHLSRSERRSLSGIMAEIGQDTRMLNQLRDRAFEKARDAMSDSKDRAILNWLEDMLYAIEGRRKLPKVHQTSAHFSPGPDCRARIIELLHRSRNQVDICVFTVTDNQVCDAIQALHRRGIPLRIITDNHKSSDYGSDIDRLAGMGIPVKVDDTDFHMHHKFAIFDREHLLTGSYNWTRSAANANNENLVVLTEPKTVGSFQKEFDRLWKSLSHYRQ